jgi:hypothetical protein
MKTVTEARNTLDTMSEIIRFQGYEIDSLRNIVVRYNLMHGTEIKGGDLAVNNSVDFIISIKKDKAFCILLDSNILRNKSQYQRIQEMIKTLEL